MTAAAAYTFGPTDGAGAFVAIESDGLGLLAAGDGGYTVQTPASSSSAAIVRADRRGLILEVRNGTPVHVNGRPVRELAMLRAGDLIVVGRSAWLIRSAAVPGIPTEEVTESEASITDEGLRTRYWLRCVVGRHAGQVREARDADDLPWQPSGVRAAARLTRTGGRLFVRASHAGSVSVDGHRVDAARLDGGEQLVVDGEHYVVESVPAIPTVTESVADGTRGKSALRTPAKTAEAPELSSESSFSPWRLLAAASLIAALFAWLLGRL